MYPQISVIIPVYNSEKYLKECLDSILKQTFTSFEVIIVDDASIDDSLSICAEYAQKDGRIQIYQQKHKGPGPARNLGIQLATGRYLLFLDSDDFFEHDMFEKLFFRAQKTRSDIVFYRYSKFDNRTGTEIKIIPNKYLSMIPETFEVEKFYDILFQLSGSEAWKYFFKANFIRQYSLKFGKTTCGEDIVFTMPARALAKRISFLNEVLVHYRVARKDQLTQCSNIASQLKKSYDCTWKILKKYNLHKVLKETFEERKKTAQIWLKTNKNYPNI